MPELPEVETIKRGLEKKIVGLTVKSVKILAAKSFIGDSQNIIGQKVTGVDRRAKIIIFKLQTGFLLIHLKMTGQLIYRNFQFSRLQLPGATATGGQAIFNFQKKANRYDVGKLPNKYTRVIIEFDNKSKLYFNDLRKFGWMKLVKDLKSLDFGPEPLTKEFSLDYFKNMLAKSKKPIKLILMDQQKIAGVGNIYANESLFLAGINPQRKANDLKTKEVTNLHGSIKEVLQAGILFGGSSTKDKSYRNLNGEKGKMQNHLRVYEKAGQKCLRCGGTIKKIQLGGRGTYFCASCQK